MMTAATRHRRARRLLVLALAGACHGADDPLVTDPTAAAPAAESPSDDTQPINGSMAASTYTGIPYGPNELTKSDGTVVWGPEPFTSAGSYADAATIVTRLNGARALNMKLVLNMTGGSHERYKTDGKFDLAKWKAVMNTYNTAAIKAAVADAVADGVIIMNSVMDEPQITDWGGVMSKPLLDDMATYVKAIFPTLPTGVVARWDWRPEEQYQVIDAILAQYQWNKGDITLYRDNILARAELEGISVIFSLNILDGGIMSWQTKDCPIPLTGGFGTKVPNCRMTADQVRNWGRLLGVAGCAMSMWRYDAEFMGKADNQQAFRDVAATLAAVPGRPCRRTGGGTPPPENAPPVAAFTAPSCTAGVACRFTDESRDDDGSIASWSWTFGNGQTSTAADPTVTYAAEGSYQVRLEVRDNDGATDAVTRTVSVSPPGNVVPTAAFTAPACTVSLPCGFSDGSHDDDGSIATRFWEFGGGATSTEQDPSHTFETEGTHGVTLTVTDDAGASDDVTRSVTVSAPNLAPIAAFTPPSCTAGTACQFTDQSRDDDGSIAARSWNFGNGQTSTQASPSVTYAAEGSYDVQLSVTDNDGATDAVTRSVTVAPNPGTPPNADFVYACSGLTCNFTDRSTDPDAMITARSWAFGDGGTSTAQNPSRTYAAAGTYTVALTLTYDGGTDQHTATVTVVAPSAGITLTATGRTSATHLFADLAWTGATGSKVTVLRDGGSLLNTQNDGRHTDSIRRPGKASYTYQVCQVKSTVCSNEVTVTFP